MAVGPEDATKGAGDGQPHETELSPADDELGEDASRTEESGLQNTETESGEEESVDLDALAGSSTKMPPPPTAKPATGGSVPFTDQARKTIAIFLLWLLAALVATSFLLLLWALQNARDVTDASDNFAVISNWLNIVFGPVVTLVGSAVGFYFGAQTARGGDSGSGQA